MIWQCKDKKIEYGEKTLIMAIINVTPDSFSDGGDNFSPNTAVNNALSAQENGADIIDIGGQSTRPGYEEISPEEEWQRIEPVLKALNGRISVPVSVDTYFPYVAEKALQNGADIINDVSGVVSPEMAQIVKKYASGWIIMHNGAGDTDEVRAFFEKSAEEIEKLGINKNQICFDMGIGFGKTRAQDMSLIANIGLYKQKDFPILLACSRKRVIKEGTGQEDLKERIYGNISAHTVGIFAGADIIRLHDVEKEKQGISMADSLKKFLK